MVVDKERSGWRGVTVESLARKHFSLPNSIYPCLLLPFAELLWQIMMCACWLLSFSSALTSSPLLIKDLVLTPVLLTRSLWSYWIG